MATLFQKPQPDAGAKTYQIDIPGAADLFHFIIPALNDKELKRKRIIRMLTHKSPVPESVQWIPDVVNQIDDAQDLLTTALWLGKPLIKKLPSRWLPIVGWALTISDIANLATTALSLATTPGLTKPDFHKIFKKERWSRKYGSADVEKWLRPGGWRRRLGDFLQAAQAADTITGIGLTLGSVMGFASDVIWAPYQLAKGNRIEIRLPPEADPLTKAYRYVTNTFKQFFAHEILSPEDHAIILAAQNMATRLIQEAGGTINQERANEAQWQQTPNYIPWEKSSIEALQEEGFDLSKQNFYKPYMWGENPQLYQLLDQAKYLTDLYKSALKREFGDTPESNIFWHVTREAAETGFEMTGLGSDDDIYQYTMEERAILQICELNFKIDSFPPGIDAYTFLRTLTEYKKYIPRDRLYQGDLEIIAHGLDIKWSTKY